MRTADKRRHRPRSPITSITNSTSPSITAARPSTRAYQTDARICLENGHFILNCEYQRRSITLMKVSGLNHAQYVGTAHKNSTPPMNRRNKTPMSRALVTLSMYAVPMTGGHPTKCTSAWSANARWVREPTRKRPVSAHLPSVSSSKPAALSTRLNRGGSSWRPLR